ncbi:uncharacterized protein LOC143253158 isoform X1 [Tachypleus tridentatus]|uniref:uncharacterized protein LOC143253158 isoform X1 n=1 Tax=Tachypleus tridentatus TaxID=6853 RepID=UPI003FD2A40D
MKKVLTITCVCVLTTWVQTHGAPTVYDVLSLVYKLCATKDLLLKQNIECLEEHLSKKQSHIGLSAEPTERNQTPDFSVVNPETYRCSSGGPSHTGAPPAIQVTPSLHNCFAEESINTTKWTETPEQSVEDIVKAFCLRSTFIFQWQETQQKTPLPITMIIGLTALRRMACVIQELHRPLPTWIFAFSKCFSYADVKKVPSCGKCSVRQRMKMLSSSRMNLNE